MLDWLILICLLHLPILLYWNGYDGDLAFELDMPMSLNMLEEEGIHREGEDDIYYFDRVIWFFIDTLELE